jgi:hypothetical protein
VRRSPSSMSKKKRGMEHHASVGGNDKRPTEFLSGCRHWAGSC